MDIWGTAVGSFLLAFSALLSIVNPVGGALIYNQVTAGRKHPERAALARKIAVYSSIVMLTALWAGASVISFFGISLAALRGWTRRGCPGVGNVVGTTRKRRSEAGASRFGNFD